ncbi:MAG: hypothetical protein SCALA701_04040 [Candidatus Scalindua sp.]|nr:response regulator [Planctomycetota bacterium]GJQ57603.1 MAG: hypothetical protein SCALA701_04040 [Candidatus Scalindua sp.]
MKTASLKDVIIKAIDFCMRGSNARCQTSIPDTLWPSKIDVGQIGQVVSNLLINADQAMPEGGIIKVCAKNVTLGIGDVPPLRPGNYIKTTIEDHGTGIPKEQTLNIFDPYYTTKQKGSGLGLSICHTIIKKHCGAISVESEIGIGSIFNFYIPASNKEVPIKDKKETAPTQGKGKVLIMDDDDLVRDTTGELLEKIGYDVALANDGDKAIAIYMKAKESGEPFDAVILDLTIPGGMGGKLAVKKLLEIDPEVKAIVASGYSNDPIMSNFREYGFSRVLAKPFEIQELNQILHAVIVG